MMALALSGPACHLFSSGEIECTRDELPDCLGVEGDADADADADTDTDADADADSDTDADADPIQGVVYIGEGTDSSSGSQIWVVEGYDEANALVIEEGDFGSVSGPVAYRSSDDVLLMAHEDRLLLVNNTGIIAVGTLPGEVRDIYAGQSYFWAITSDGLYRVNSAGASEQLRDTSFQELTAVFPAASGELFILDRGGSTNSPSLYRYDTRDESLTLEYGSYDITRNRSIDGFQGVDDEPFVCSAAGGAYRVADVANEDTAPERLATGSLTDIVDCGYDAGSDEVILFSASRGVFRVQSTGATTRQVELVEADRLLRGTTFAP
ncbi:MAG: hypothetical protein H6739_22620 [Alphaproteobacteria bacterium]|nr:hypothetical protein [Alphaproteobacteria bacterium]